ncbi:PSP1 domain-containing protein [Trichloromonas sp.]|uniref:PSP1 domain-containing protein n=1 Tax=Trichloromonas sp. TaxID=3069249 RepID=UPI002A3CB935|nr:stage 0 sporulation family protein [Trichloromonas sp.]
MPRIVSLKFRDAGKHYFFNPLDLELAKGDRVVVETDRGRALATVVAPPEERPEDQLPADLKNVIRIAGDDDLAMAQANVAREREAYIFCQERIQKRTMEMKLVRAEYLFDGSKIIFYFTADGRVDFRELVKDLAHHFHTRIEMRQIGVRDEAKLIGGIGICGRELCCCTFLTEFTPVSVRMAKEQGLALNPTKISGQCGRLLCCLSYEFDTYCGLKKSLPKCGRKVQLDGIKGEVVNQDVLRQKVLVRLEDGRSVSVTADQIEQGKGPTPVLGEETSRRNRPAPSGRSRSGRGESHPPSAAAPANPPPKPAKPAPPAEVKPQDPPAEGEEAAKTSRKRSRSRRRPRRK